MSNTWKISKPAVGLLLVIFLSIVPTTAPTATQVDAENPILIELFTSQGCSSCPPADAILHELATRDDVIALSLPVDYWDYLGWKDTLAMPAFTQRQQAYAKQLNLRSVYTPQIIIDGVTDAVGIRQHHIERAIELRAEMLGTRRIPITPVDQGTAIVIRIGDGAPPKHESTLWLVRYNRHMTVNITRGENAGKTMTYTNVVRELTPIGMWDGTALELRLPKSSLRAGYDGAAIILQADNTGPILGAARLAAEWLSPATP